MLVLVQCTLSAHSLLQHVLEVYTVSKFTGALCRINLHCQFTFQKCICLHCTLCVHSPVDCAHSKSSHWHRLCTREVVLVRTTCSSSAKQLTVVYCAPGLHLVIQVRCSAHHHYCALCKRTVYRNYGAKHDRSRDGTYPNMTRGAFHKCQIQLLLLPLI